MLDLQKRNNNLLTFEKKREFEFPSFFHCSLLYIMVRAQNTRTCGVKCIMKGNFMEKKCLSLKIIDKNFPIHFTAFSVELIPYNMNNSNIELLSLSCDDEKLSDNIVCVHEKVRIKNVFSSLSQSDFIDIVRLQSKKINDGGSTNYYSISFLHSFVIFLTCQDSSLLGLTQIIVNRQKNLNCRGKSKRKKRNLKNDRKSVQATTSKKKYQILNPQLDSQLMKVKEILYSFD